MITIHYYISLLSLITYFHICSLFHSLMTMKYISLYTIPIKNAKILFQSKPLWINNKENWTNIFPINFRPFWELIFVTLGTWIAATARPTVGGALADPPYVKLTGPVPVVGEATRRICRIFVVSESFLYLLSGTWKSWEIYSLRLVSDFFGGLSFLGVCIVNHGILWVQPDRKGGRLRPPYR